jgi:hypothetical protein
VIPHTDAGVELFEGGHERRIRRLQRRHELVELLDASLNTSTTNVSTPIIQLEQLSLSP